CCQYFSWNPAASSRSRRNSPTGTCSSRNRDVVSRKNAWSSVGCNSIRTSSLRPRERLHLEILVEPGDAVLSSYPALLEATERYVGAVGAAAVDVQCAGADPAGDIERPVERAGVHRAAEPVHALVGDADGVVGV